MSKDTVKKTLVLGLILLFFGFITTPNIIGSNSIDDSTPPITTILVDPPAPNGDNGWYVCDVNITLNAYDDNSGVKTIYYKIPGEEWENHSGDSIIIMINYDCLIGFFEYYSEDNAGNLESIRSWSINIDQEKPFVELTYEVEGNSREGWKFIFTAYAIDDCSGMDRAEFYINDTLQKTVTGPGPEYIFNFMYNPQGPPFFVIGLISNPKIIDDSVSFFAIIVKISAIGAYIPIHTIVYDIAGNHARDEILPTKILEDINPGLYIFKNVELPNNYQGYIGKYFIWAEFM